MQECLADDRECSSCNNPSFQHQGCFWWQVAHGRGAGRSGAHAGRSPSATSQRSAWRRAAGSTANDAPLRRRGRLTRLRRFRRHRRQCPSRRHRHRPSRRHRRRPSSRRRHCSRWSNRRSSSLRLRRRLASSVALAARRPALEAPLRRLLQVWPRCIRKLLKVLQSVLKGLDGGVPCRFPQVFRLMFPDIESLYGGRRPGAAALVSAMLGMRAGHQQQGLGEAHAGECPEAPRPLHRRGRAGRRHGCRCAPFFVGAQPESAASTWHEEMPSATKTQALCHAAPPSAGPASAAPLGTPTRSSGIRPRGQVCS